MSYLKGKDIKCPFDCLFHYYTRRFEVIYTRPDNVAAITPKEFEKW